MSVEFTTPTIIVTKNATDQVHLLLEDDSMKDEGIVGLRVFVQGGGCSGFQYGFTFEEIISDDDIVIEQNGIKVLVDELSYQYLVGSTVDYKTEVFGSRFEISNPNSTGTCGCGSSFKV
jgi:iron-sulfur cluster insertion protein